MNEIIQQRLLELAPAKEQEQENALVQSHHWNGQEDLEVGLDWLKMVLQEKITGIDRQDAADDVAPFLRAAEKHSLKLWSARFFSEKVARIG